LKFGYIIARAEILRQKRMRREALKNGRTFEGAHKAPPPAGGIAPRVRTRPLDAPAPPGV